MDQSSELARLMLVHALGKALDFSQPYVAYLAGPLNAKEPQAQHEMMAVCFRFLAVPAEVTRAFCERMTELTDRWCLQNNAQVLRDIRLRWATQCNPAARDGDELLLFICVSLVIAERRREAETAGTHPLVWAVVGAGVMALVGLGVTFATYKPREVASPKTTAPRTTSPPAPRPVAAPAATVEWQWPKPAKPTQKPTPFVPPILPLPPNGQVVRYSKGRPVASLEISTRSGGGHFYVIVMDLAKKPVASVFVREGSKAKFDVPLGTYRLKYAGGRVWSGPKYLFGEQTSLSIAETDFTFEQVGNSVSGYSVELFLQAHGNLTTHSIDMKEFLEGLEAE